MNFRSKYTILASVFILPLVGNAQNITASAPDMVIKTYNDPKQDAALKAAVSQFESSNKGKSVILVTDNASVKSLLPSPAPKKIKRHKQNKSQSAQTLSAMRFDFTFHDDVGNLPLALKEYDPSLRIYSSIGRKQALQFNTDLSNTNVDEIAAAVQTQSGGKVSLIYDSIANTIRLSYSSKITSSDFAASVIEESKKLQTGYKLKPVPGVDGDIRFPFGGPYPVICKPLKECDIRLEPGEIIRGWTMSDKEMWIVPGANAPQIIYSGEDGNTMPHIILKPADVGLDSNLIVTTNKRTYNIDLQSSQKGYIKSVSFYYPADINQGIADQRSNLRAQAQSQGVIPLNSGGSDLSVWSNKASPDSSEQSMVPVTNINWNYEVSGDDVPWKPTQAFDDGVHVWLKFPATAQIAPPLFELDDNDQKKGLLIYEVEPGGYYRIDTLFERAGLIVGKGDYQQQVLITRISTQKPWYKKIFGG